MYRTGEYSTTGDIPCKCCGGCGTQRNRQTGLIVHCPCCGGTGKERK